MKSVFLDTSDEYLKLAIDGKSLDIIFEKIEPNQTDFHFRFNHLLKRNGTSYRDLNRIFVNRGPGSFMGVRLAVMVAKTLAYLNPNSHLYGVDAFGLMELALKRRNDYQEDRPYLMIRPLLKSNFMLTLLRNNHRQTVISKLKMGRQELTNRLHNRDELKKFLNYLVELKILDNSQTIQKKPEIASLIDECRVVGYREDFTENSDELILIEHNRSLIEYFFTSIKNHSNKNNRFSPYHLIPIYL